MSVRKKNIIISIIIIAAFALVVICVGFNSLNADGAEYPEELPSFINELGLTVSSSEPVIKNAVIPSEFSEVYSRYNSLQLEAGYDLSRYKGESAVIYTYNIIDYPDGNGGFLKDIKANIIICSGKIIGGDIGSTALDGFMTGLIPPNM